MTSKDLCFKLMKEDAKRRIWTIALTALGLLFTILIPTAIKSGEFRDLVEKESVGGSYIRESIISLLRTGGGAVAVLMIGAVLWAVTGFHYLHNSRKVDFYHSIPVKRRQLFLAAYVNGILIPAVIYLVVLLPSVSIALQAGVGMDAIGLIPWQGYVMHMLYYSLLYTTTVAAMMLTSNIVIALLGTAVFCGYGPAVISLTLAYFNSWFHTFTMTERQERSLIRMLWYSSPFGNYLGAVGDFNSGLWYPDRLAGVAVVTVLLAVISYLLYRARPSEAAGRAMAFGRVRMPIKVLLVIPISVAFGMFFYMLRSHLTWLVFGTLCGCALSHCLIEIIYHFDFRRLLANKLHLAGCAGVSLLLVLAGYFDWYGYDSWVPDADQVESSAICLYDREDWVTYGKVDTMPMGRGKIRYYWNYKNRADYCYETMDLTDSSLALEIARRGADSDKMRRKDGDFGAGPRERFMIQFRLKNGKTVQRRYWVPVDEEMTGLICSIHDNEQYRLGAYPIMKQTEEETTAVYVQQFGMEEIKVEDGDEEGLLTAYQEEWKNLSAATREKEFPIGIIRFETADMMQVRKEYEELGAESGGAYYYDLAERCYYPVYPSFSKTLGILEDRGFTFMTLDENTVSKICIEYRTVYDDQAVGYDGEVQVLYEGEIREYEEKEDIRNLLPALCYGNYQNMSGGFYGEDPAYVSSVTVYLEDSDQELLSFYLDRNRLSPEMNEQYGFYRGA